MKPAYSVAETDTVEDLKALIFSQTTVPVKRQKLLGLTKGKLPTDETILAHLKLHERAGKEFSVVGQWDVVLHVRDADV